MLQCSFFPHQGHLWMSGLNRIKAAQHILNLSLLEGQPGTYHSLCPEISKCSSSKNTSKSFKNTDTDWHGRQYTFYNPDFNLGNSCIFLLFSSFPFLTDPYGVGFERRHLITVIRALARTSFCQTTIVRILMHIQQEIHFKESENTLHGISEKIHPFWWGGASQ